MTRPASKRSPARAKVLIIVQNLPVPFDRRVWSEARALVGAGYGVSVISPTGRGYERRYEEIEGIHVYRHPMPFEARSGIGYPLEYAISLFFEVLLSLRVLRERGFDVVHACNPPDTIFLIGGLYKLLLGKRFVFDHHDLCPELYEAKFARRGFVHRILQRLERWTFRSADAVISTNQSYRRIALERGRVPSDRVFVVRSGPDLERVRLRPPRPELKRGRRHLVGYVGVIGRQEGLAYLLEAVRHVVHDRGRQDVHFGIVGDGPELPTIRAEAARLRVEEFVTFTGRLPDDDMFALLSTADLCVNPDEVNAMNDKSTMNKIMEYMALAKPIVQFDTTEGRVSAGEASLYAAANDATDLAAKIIELLDDPGRRARMGRAGWRRVRDVLAWEHEAGKLLAAYGSVITPRPAAGTARAAPATATRPGGGGS